MNNKRHYIIAPNGEVRSLNGRENKEFSINGFFIVANEKNLDVVLDFAHNDTVAIDTARDFAKKLNKEIYVLEINELWLKFMRKEYGE
jgi:hypothetical protein